ncbi:MAG TPA: pyridoxal phosphate-dependent aminotransferase [Synergistales bacterium]|nr:pyridoxal phosphate-dependent aminotransferase [Synergistales bacterium]
MNNSHRVTAFPRSGIRKMSAMALSMDDVISLCIGEPDLETPPHIVEAGVDALRGGFTHYAPSGGLMELKQAVAGRYRTAMGLEYGPENVIITLGSTQGLLHSFLGALNPGDEILLPDPYYPNYLGQLHIAGIKVVTVPVKEEKGFRLQAEDLEKALTPSTRAVLLNSPNNPTGAVLEREDLARIADVVMRHDLTVISDEVYDSIIYDDGGYCSIAQIPGMQDRVIIHNGFSKTYAMTGWRLGYIVAPSKYVEESVYLQEALISCAPTFTQVAAEAALRESQDCVYRMNEIYSRRRSIVLEGLNDITGVNCYPTGGAFYAFPNISSFGKSSEDFAIDLLKKGKVATVPGSYFGANGEGYLRLSFAASDNDLTEAIGRFRKYVLENY